MFVLSLIAVLIGVGIGVYMMDRLADVLIFMILAAAVVGMYVFFENNDIENMVTVLCLGIAGGFVAALLMLPLWQRSTLYRKIKEKAGK